MLLIVILILVTVMTFVAIARALFSRGVTSQVLRSSLGIQAQTLAESAAEEVLLEVRRRANDPESESFVPFRVERYAGEEASFPVQVETPRFDSLYERIPEISPFYLEDRSAVVSFQRQFTGVPYERYGLLKVSATVARDMSLTTKVSRRVELGVEFKVHLVSTPRPFDQAALYVQDGGALLGRPYQMIEDVLQSIEYRRSEHEDVIDQMESRKDSVPFNGVATLTRHRNLQIQEAAYWRQKAPPLREPSALFALGRAPDGVDVSLLRIEARMRDAYRALQLAEEDYQEARGNLSAAFDSIEKHNQYLAKLKVLLGATSEMVGIMENFLGLFQVWDDTKFEGLVPPAYKLEPDEWRRKATIILDRDPDGRSPQVLLDKLIGETDRLNGVFYSNWPGKSLSLRGRTIPGRVVLVCEETTVNLSDVNLAATGDDLLTVVSFGQVNLSGTVNASVMALGGLSMAAGTEIKGNLVLKQVKNPGDLEGRVEYDPKYHSGRTTTESVAEAKTQYYWVSIGPRPLYKAVHRQ